jgi:hypothetical protein
MSADSQPDEAVEVLRQVWDRRGQSIADIEGALGPQRSCRAMENVGFEGWAGLDGPVHGERRASDQAESAPADRTGAGADMRAAWRATLERDGKLRRGSGSVRDLVLGQAEPKR